MVHVRICTYIVYIYAGRLGVDSYQLWQYQDLFAITIVPSFFTASIWSVIGLSFTNQPPPCSYTYTSLLSHPSLYLQGTECGWPPLINVCTWARTHQCALHILTLYSKQETQRSSTLSRESSLVIERVYHQLDSNSLSMLLITHRKHTRRLLVLTGPSTFSTFSTG